MQSVLAYVYLLSVAVLVGKVVLLSFVVAPVLAKTLDREPFGLVVRRLFPAYYALGMLAAMVGLMAVAGLGFVGGMSTELYAAGGLWLLVLAAETYCRSPLTPQSNTMRDRLKLQESQGLVDPALQTAWNRLHQRSIYLNSAVLLTGLCLLGLAGRW